jgi:hypothetical protein
LTDELSKARVNTGIIYELTESEVLDLYYSEPRLAALLELGVICLVDRHLVVNLKEFITPKTRHLTAYAKKYKSACCVGIQYSLEKADSDRRIKCTLDLIIEAATFLENTKPTNGNQSTEEIEKESDKISSEIDRIHGIMNNLPGSFSGSLKKHMERKGYTEELLSQESWISLSTIKQYRQKEDKEKTLKTVTAICIGLHLHPWLTEDMIRKAGLALTATKLDGAYRYLYTFHYKDTIEDCNKYLRSQNLPEFKLREKTL